MKLKIIFWSFVLCSFLLFGWAAAYAATVWTQQPGVYKQLKSNAATPAKKYVLMTAAELQTFLSGTSPLFAPAVVVAPPPVVAVPPPVVVNPIPPPVVVVPPATTSFIPVINNAFLPARNFGSPELRIRPQSSSPSPDSGDHGAFRVSCGFAHMLYDDPIVFPGMQGKSHLHAFFGNVGTNYASTSESIRLGGNSTCDGGIANRSAYWVPAMIDTKTHKPIKPNGALIYYKSGPASLVPRGLRMISGDVKRTASIPDSWNRHQDFVCDGVYNGHKDNIVACGQGGVLTTSVSFPDCWDGKNLDSPNHKDHMYFSSDNGSVCPATHPKRLPTISVLVYYPVTDADGTKWWRLASDNYDPTTTYAGYSSHSDFMMGWDETIHKTYVDNCVNKALDCHGDLLGDGRELY